MQSFGAKTAISFVGMLLTLFLYSVLLVMLQGAFGRHLVGFRGAEALILYLIPALFGFVWALTPILKREFEIDFILPPIFSLMLAVPVWLLWLAWAGCGFFGECL